ncbi:MAG TPA: glycosyl hydrolase [Baekduia sp.]
MTIRPWALLAGLAGLLVLLTAPAAATARPLFGVQVDSIQPTDTPGQVDAELHRLATLHAQTVRVEVDWSQLEPHVQGRRDPVILADLDRIVDGAARQGLAVVMFADRSPCWASSAPVKPNCLRRGSNTFEVTRYGPSDPQTYVDLATFLAARYGSDLRAFEVWNEPDQANQNYWAGPDKVNRYVALLEAVYGPLKQVNPGLQVLAGSFIGTDGRWLKALYAAGARGSYDALSVHFYDLPLNALATTHAVQLAHHDTTPLWLTEYGWTSCAGTDGASVPNDHPCVTQATQAQSIVDVVRALHATSWVAAAIMYTMSDQTPAYQFGLVDRADRLKPAFGALQQALSRPLGPLRVPGLTLRRAGRRTVVSGTGSLADLYTLEVSVHGRLRYRAQVRTTRTGRYTVTLPAVLGTRGLRVRITSRWSHRATTRTL